VLITTRTEPIVLDFDPNSVTTPLNVYIVFRDHAPRSVWLLMRSDSNPSPSTQECLRVGDSINRNRPGTVQDLFDIIRKESRFLSGDYAEHADLLERLFQAVTGVRPVEYLVKLDAAL